MSLTLTSLPQSVYFSLRNKEIWKTIQENSSLKNIEYLWSFYIMQNHGHLESACFMSPSQCSKIDFSSPTRKTKWITHNYQGQGERGNWGSDKYLFASPGNLCNSVWICQLIFKCLDDLYEQSMVSHLSTVTLNHLCINIYRFIHMTYSWQSCIIIQMGFLTKGLAKLSH